MTRFCWLALLVVLGVARAGSGAIRFELPEIVVAGSNTQATTGFYDVVVRADTGDLPQQVGGFNVDFSTTSLSVEFDEAQEPPSPLISGPPLDFSPDLHRVLVAQDVFPSSVALFDGAGLVRVVFRVPAGVSGVFPIGFGSFNQLADEFAEPIAFQATDTGSITVNLPGMIPGDYDRNGSVGPEDYNVWKASFGSTSDLAADGNENAVVDAADYVFWRDRLAPAAGSGSCDAGLVATRSIAVPEPSTALSLILGLGLLAVWHGLMRLGPQRRS
jgi:hypothetical protein